MKKTLLILSIMMLLVMYSCITESGMARSVADGKKIYIENETIPSEVFYQADMTGVSVMTFDAKYVQTFDGKIVNYGEIANNFTDDLIKEFYKLGEIKVAVGEYEDTIFDVDHIEKKSGDLDIRTSSQTRTTSYKAVPFKKIDTILNGRINKFSEHSDLDKSFIEVNIKLIGTYDGEVYWITKLNGYYEDVISTIVKTISYQEYTPPAEKVIVTEDDLDQYTEDLGDDE